MRTDFVTTYNAAAATFRDATRVYIDALDAERKRAEKALHFAGLIAATEVLGAAVGTAGGERGDLTLAMLRADEALHLEAAE